MTNGSVEARELVGYDLDVTVADGRVVLRGTSKDGDTWMVAMLPSPAVHLSLALAECARTIEEGVLP